MWPTFKTLGADRTGMLYHVLAALIFFRGTGPKDSLARSALLRDKVVSTTGLAELRLGGIEPVPSDICQKETPSHCGVAMP